MGQSAKNLPPKPNGDFEMASCAKCGKHPLRKSRSGIFRCQHCGPRPPVGVEPDAPAAESIFTAQDGRVFHRGIYLPDENCAGLLKLLRSTTGLYARTDAELADDLEAAMRLAAQYEQMEAA